MFLRSDPSPGVSPADPVRRLGTLRLVGLLGLQFRTRPWEPRTGDSHAHLLRRLTGFCESLGYSVSFEAIDGPGGGWCDPEAKRIVIDAGVAPNAQLRTLVHECAHALGVDYQQYSREQSEVLADTISFVACSSIGLTVDGETIPYVAGWGEDGALEAVTEFAQTIDGLARRIEDALTTDPPSPRTDAAAATAISELAAA